MQLRPMIVAGNHKMHLDREAFAEYVATLNPLIEQRADQLRALTVLLPSFLHLPVARQSLIQWVAVGGQNCHWDTEGAYTGEVSAIQLRSYGCSYVLIGHSERRQYFGETEATLLKKIEAAFAAGLTPIYCCGEDLHQRRAGQHFETVANQIDPIISKLSATVARQIIIAYEPVWAIGTGQTASPAQAQQMHAFIRGRLQTHHGEEVAKSVPILYGGSVKPTNAVELFSCTDIDGGLVGGASLNPTDFVAIIDAAHEII